MLSLTRDMEPQQQMRLLVKGKDQAMDCRLRIHMPLRHQFGLDRRWVFREPTNAMRAIETAAGWPEGLELHALEC